jgi:hypothetical protein
MMMMKRSFFVDDDDDYSREFEAYICLVLLYGTKNRGKKKKELKCFILKIFVLWCLFVLLSAIYIITTLIIIKFVLFFFRSLLISVLYLLNIILYATAQSAKQRGYTSFLHILVFAKWEHDEQIISDILYIITEKNNNNQTRERIKCEYEYNFCFFLLSGARAIC